MNVTDYMDVFKITVDENKTFGGLGFLDATDAPIDENVVDTEFDSLEISVVEFKGTSVGTAKDEALTFEVTAGMPYLVSASTANVNNWLSHLTDLEPSDV